jgi:HAD superfamily hydrolase (TIGR01509 family)
MKTILIDAVYAFIIETEEGFKIFEPMQKMLDEFPNRKIILTSASDEKFEKYRLDKMPYEVFTLKHNPEKTDPEYYKKMLEHFNLKPEDVVYFEHSSEAVKSAESVGIKTMFWNNETRPLEDLKKFLENSIS